MTEATKTTEETKAQGAAVADAKQEKAKVVTPKRGKKKKKIKQISHGRAYVQATYNNTIVTLTDLKGNSFCCWYHCERCCRKSKTIWT
jgi:ribosomal protein S11